MQADGTDNLPSYGSTPTPKKYKTPSGPGALGCDHCFTHIEINPGTKVYCFGQVRTNHCTFNISPYPSTDPHPLHIIVHPF